MRRFLEINFLLLQTHLTNRIFNRRVVRVFFVVGILKRNLVFFCGIDWQLIVIVSKRMSLFFNYLIWKNIFIWFNLIIIFTCSALVFQSVFIIKVTCRAKTVAKPIKVPIKKPFRNLIKHHIINWWYQIYWK